MTTGDIATWIIGAIILILFVIVLKKVYRNFASGKCGSCSSCSSGSCSSGCGCGTEHKVSSKAK